MMSHPLTLLAALTLCLAPFACDVEDDAHEPTSDQAALLEESEEITDLALASYAECQDEHPQACADEEEDLVEALQSLELARGDQQLRATAGALCTGKLPVSCTAPGTCYGTDDVGCVCMANGALTDVESCAQSPVVVPPEPEPPCGPCSAGRDCHCGDICWPIGAYCP